MMGWLGRVKTCGLGWVQKFWVGLGFEKVTHDQLCGGRITCLYTLFSLPTFTWLSSGTVAFLLVMLIGVYS